VGVGKTNSNGDMFRMGSAAAEKANALGDEVPPGLLCPVAAESAASYDANTGSACGPATAGRTDG
jgi:hypothetical protein